MIRRWEIDTLVHKARKYSFGFFPRHSDITRSPFDSSSDIATQPHHIKHSRRDAGKNLEKKYQIKYKLV